MSHELAGKIAVVTGGAKGIGWGIAERFLVGGARVVILDMDGNALASAGDRARSLGHGGSVEIVQGDAAAPEGVAAAIETARRRFAGLDCMVCNAGGPAGALGPVLDTSLEQFDAAMALNLRSAFIGITLAARALIEQGRGGSILTMGSISAQAGGAGPPVYSAAKAGLVRLVKNVSAEFAPHAIRVNSLSPGLILTPSFEAAGATPEFASGLQPLRLAGRPSHVGDAAVFLASDKAAFITGCDFVIDGGALAEGIGLYRKLVED